VLRALINSYKYNSIRAVASCLAKLLADSYNFSKNDVIVPLPTIARHVRERGFGHIELLACVLARLVGARSIRLLDRANNSVQVGSDGEMRKLQAEHAYRLRQALDSSLHYFLLDDVWTTGSSMMAATKILRSAGAQYVNAIVVAKTV